MRGTFRCPNVLKASVGMEGPSRLLCLEKVSESPNSYLFHPEARTLLHVSQGTEKGAMAQEQKGSNPQQGALQAATGGATTVPLECTVQGAAWFLKKPGQPVCRDAFGINMAECVKLLPSQGGDSPQGPQEGPKER